MLREDNSLVFPLSVEFDLYTDFILNFEALSVVSDVLFILYN